MFAFLTALVPCLSLIVLAVCGVIIATRKNSGQIKDFKFSLTGLEIRFDKDSTDA